MFAFLLYDSRSGSTLLSALLNRYRGIAVLPESSFVSRILEYRKPLLDEVDLHVLLDDLYAEIQFTELGLDRDMVYAHLCTLDKPYYKRDLIAGLVTLCFEQKTAENDSEALVRIIKHAPYAHLAQLCRLFPALKYIHLIRDGRAVYHSKKKTYNIQRRPMERSVIKAALDWRRKLRTAQRFSAFVCEVRYEDVTRNPDVALETLLDFFEVPAPNRQVTQSQQDYYARIGAQQKPLHPHVQGKPEPAHNTTWKAGLTPPEIGVYELINRDLLQEKGYEITEATDFKNRCIYTLWLMYFLMQYVYVRVSNACYSVFVSRSLKEKVRRQLMRWSSSRRLNAAYTKENNMAGVGQ